MNEAPIRQEREAVVLALHVQPGAKRSQWAGRHGEALKLRVAAPAVEGKANEALVRFLAEFCGVPRAAIEIVQGETGRAKRVRIATSDPQAVAARLATLL
ncbi:MAG: YggU family protein [Rhodocyclales bacterium]|nr:YggU family protein [Rhodocyclales bacterium]